MKVAVKIHETWIDKIEPNQPAEIKVEAFPDKTFTGTVLKKAPLADAENWLNPDLKVYATDVAIDGTHGSHLGTCLHVNCAAIDAERTSWSPYCSAIHWLPSIKGDVPFR
jgi:hypothetical protein